MLTAPVALHAQDCEKVKLIDFPRNDLPPGIDTSRSMQEELKVNGSYKFYYGIGVPVDYVKARHLAFIEMTLVDKDPSDPFSGAAILMMLYANGFGVNRDLDISIRLACANVGFADAEIEGRVDHLKKLKLGQMKGVFDLCDDITSGYMMGFCAGVHAELDSIRRQASIDSVIKGWTTMEKEAYISFRKAASAFFKARVVNEVDLSGTARAAEEIGEDESLEDGFRLMLITADNCAFESYTMAQWETTDQQLNSLYSKIMQTSRSEWGTVTRQGIRSAQRAWIRYRDAWVAFAMFRCPKISAESLKTSLTKERIGQLEEWIAK